MSVKEYIEEKKVAFGKYVDKQKLKRQEAAERKAVRLEKDAEYSKELRGKLERQDKARKEIHKLREHRQKSGPKLNFGGSSIGGSSGDMFGSMGLGGGSSGGDMFGDMFGRSSSSPTAAKPKRRKKRKSTSRKKSKRR